MLASFASAVHDMLADAILRSSRTQSQSELIALAWTLRNGLERARPDADALTLDPEQARKLTESLMTDTQAASVSCEQTTPTNCDAREAYTDMTFRQALACVSLVFDGLVPDPTHGATRAHPHDQMPNWSKDFEATALIGPLMFLRERANAQQTGKADAS
jgi:hypothetical protein